MTFRGLAPVLATLILAAALPSASLARNPHCAGGIQYVSQADNDKRKGNTEDYQREIRKAVQQLEICVSEDPNDQEALAYLGWAYAEVDSAELAGKAFAKAIEGLTAKGDKKKVEWAIQNRESYWATAYNDGIKQITDAQAAYPDFSKPPADDADKTLKGEAGKKYAGAITSLTRAALLKPGDPRTVGNLATAYALMGEFQKADAVLSDGLKAAPGDTELTSRLKTVRTNYASALLKQEKFDDAIAYYADLLKASPNDPELHLGLADAYYRRANTKDGDAKKPDFKAAAAEYQRAGELKPDDADLTFNAGLSYRNAGEWALAEPMWRATIQRRPDDMDAVSSLAEVLAELKKFDEAIAALCKGVAAKPDNKTLHRQLGAVYGKMNRSKEQVEHLMVYLALQNGKPEADAASAAKQSTVGTAAVATLKSDGVPDQVIRWEFQGEKIESWFYWTKRVAYHFKSGVIATRSDWSRCSAAAAGGGKS